MRNLKTFGTMLAGLTFGVISAPMAAALEPSRRTCQDSGTTIICQTNGNAEIAVKPGTTRPPANRPGWFLGANGQWLRP